MDDRAALGPHQAGGMIEEFPRRRAAPAFVRGRKMLADIALADGAQDGIGQRVQAGIGIGMAFQRMIVRDLHAAEPDMIARHEAVDVIARSGARFAQASRKQASAKAKSSALVIFMLISSPPTATMFKPANSASAISSVTSPRRDRDGLSGSSQSESLAASARGTVRRAAR